MKFITPGFWGGTEYGNVLSSELEPPSLDRTLLEKLQNNNEFLDCAHLPTGIYVIHALDGQQVFKNQWIKQ